jgi:hypothetical protein
VRCYRTGLLPRMCDEEPLFRPWVEDAWIWQIGNFRRFERFSMLLVFGRHIVDVEIIRDSANRKPQVIGNAISERRFVVDIGVAAGRCPKASNGDALDLPFALFTDVRSLGKAEDMLGVEIRSAHGAPGLGLLAMGQGGQQKTRDKTRGRRQM